MPNLLKHSIIKAILVILVIVIIAIVVILYSGESNGHEIPINRPDIPSHLFMTKERAGLVVHYLSSEDHVPITSQSRLKVWHFDRFSKVSCRQTVIFFTRYDDIYRYTWLINLCKEKSMNLALVHVDPELIGDLRLARNWSHSNIILATDSDSKLLVRFAEIDAEHRSVVDHSLYRSVVVLCHDVPSQLPRADKIILITDDEGYEDHSDGNVVVRRMKWTSLTDEQPNDASIVLDQVVDLLS